MSEIVSPSTQIVIPSNANSNKPKYIQFPLCTLALFHESPVETLKNIVAYGISYRTKNLHYNDHDVIRQMIYDYYRGVLYSESLREELDSDSMLNSDDLSDGRWLFDPEDGAFIPDEGDLTDLYRLCGDIPDLRERAVYNYKVTRAIGNRDIDYPDIYTENRTNIIRTHQEKQKELFGKQPMPSVNTDIIFWFIENPENIHLFSAYTAIKSLIGKHDYTATNKDVVVMRMIGAKSNDALSKALKNKQLKEIYDHYTIPYQFRRLTETLRDNNFIQSSFGYRRKYFFSTTLDHDKLGDRANQYFAERNYKKLEREARAKLAQRN